VSRDIFGLGRRTIIRFRPGRRRRKVNSRGWGMRIDIGLMGQEASEGEGSKCNPGPLPHMTGFGTSLSRGDREKED